MEMNLFVVFCSPSGSTKHVAEVIADSARALPAHVHTLDLGKERDWSEVLGAIQASGSNGCVFIGSPVYRDLAVPPVMKFIAALPEVAGGFAVPFATWGGATSGIALWQMATELQNKGFLIAGAAKVLAVHSLMWGSEDPLGQGHPDAQDDLALQGLVRAVSTRVQDRNFTAIPLSRLDYQTPERAAEMKHKLTEPAGVTPRTVDEAKCTLCEMCVDQCPAAAIALAPFPQFNAGCFDCFNCIRCCPEAAIQPKITLAQIEPRIRKRAEMMSENTDPATW
jgi:NAD-dependent dihydropyrimidine dehydrogenase PreA subunit